MSNGLVACPACGATMVEEDFGSARVDVCPTDGCSGILFDPGEIDRIQADGQGFGPALERALAAPRIDDTERGPLSCPRCRDAMEARAHPDVESVRLDVCFPCGLIFLDGGELAALRATPKPGEERARRRRARRRERRMHDWRRREVMEAAEEFTDALVWGPEPYGLRRRRRRRWFR